MLHELSYGGFDDVADDAEDEPEIVRVRRRLEEDLEASLRERWPGVPEGVDLAAGFFDWVAGTTAPRSPGTSRPRRPTSRCSTCSGSARSTTSRRPTPRRG